MGVPRALSGRRRDSEPVRAALARTSLPAIAGCEASPERGV